MNYNRNEVSFHHLSNILSNPAQKAALQSEFDKKRFAMVQDVLAHRVQLIPMRFTLDALGRVQSYNQQTQPLNNDLIVVGYMSDKGTRDIILQKAEKEKPLVYIGDASGLYLNLADIAGQPQNTNPKGQKGIFYLPCPRLFYKTERISLDVFKTEDTDDAETLNFVIVAYRVLPREISQGLFMADKALIEEYVSKRTTPETLFLKNEIVFDIAETGGHAEFFTPQLDEPVILRGVRSSMNECRITLALEGDAPLTMDKTPIWALAHGDEIPHENYLWLQRGLYIPAKTQLRGNVYNDGESFDPQGVDGENQITWCIQTV